MENNQTLSQQQKVGQLFFPAAFINDSDENIKALERLIRECWIGGLTFFHSPQMAATNYEKRRDIPRNDESCQRLKELIQHYQSVANYPLLVSIDAEWGLAMRVENAEQYPYALSLGASQDPYLVFETGEAVAKDLKAVGIHLNLAPVLDINLDPANPVIGYRSFGQDKQRVAKLALAFYRGLRSVGILGCAKHFPGHGDTAVDSHLGLPVIRKSSKELFEQDLFPFVEAIELGIDCVMPGHLAVPALNEGQILPSSLSKSVVTGLLRDHLGYEGVVITDALNMKAVADRFEHPGELELAALDAGNDVLSFSSNIPAAIELISQRYPSEQLERSFTRVDQLKHKAGLFNSPPRKDRAASSSPQDPQTLREQLALSIITIVKKGTLISAGGSEKVACVSVYKPTKQAVFCKIVSAFKSIPIYEMVQFSRGNGMILQESLGQYERIIIALYVPSVKPMNKFGMSQSFLDWLTVMMRKKRIDLVIFGNPYSLRHINFELAGQVILAYQDLKEFEKKAAEYLFGKVEVNGKLPVTIDETAAGEGQG